LWYWKTEVQIDTLKNIEVHLQNVEEKLSQRSVRIVEKAEGEEAQKDDAEASEETEEMKGEPAPAGLTAVGRSGRIYTEAELELQIRE
jgi:N-acetylmuramic acid 6-phosphate (MurNAc-6-P) etherase